MKIFLKIKREWFVFLQKITNFRAKICYFGLKVKVPMIYKMGRDLIVPDEKLMSKFLKVFLRHKQGTVIDIGANVGIYLLKLKAIEQERKYIGIEPNPSAFFYLTELIKINNFQDSHVFPIAFSNKESVSTLFFSVPGDCGASFNQQAHSLSTNVITQTGEKLLNELHIEDIAIVKIDTEGHELPTLEGLQNILRQYNPIIYCEVWHLPEQDAANYQHELLEKQQLIDFLQQLDYQIIGVGNNTVSFTLINTATQFNSSMRTEYIFTHKHEVNPLLEKLHNAL
jgi:FkbM family methyltransferase